MTDRESGKSRGFGFVTYTQSPMVDDAMNNRLVFSSLMYELSLYGFVSLLLKFFFPIYSFVTGAGVSSSDFAQVRLSIVYL